jgi:hypothetical protein
LKTIVFIRGLLLAVLLFSGLACAQSPQPAGGLDYLLYITVIIMIFTFVLAFINFLNINNQKKLLEDERKELIRQRQEWEINQCKKIEDFQKEERKEISDGKKDFAVEELKLEKNLAAVEVYLKELEDLKKDRKEDITKIESELLRIQAERQKITEDENRIAEDKKKIEKDLRDIEGMWADVENAMKTLASGKPRKKKDE